MFKHTLVLVAALASCWALAEAQPTQVSGEQCPRSMAAYFTSFPVPDGVKKMYQAASEKFGEELMHHMHLGSPELKQLIKSVGKDEAGCKALVDFLDHVSAVEVCGNPDFEDDEKVSAMVRSTPAVRQMMESGLLCEVDLTAVEDKE